MTAIAIAVTQGAAAPARTRTTSRIGIGIFVSMSVHSLSVPRKLATAMCGAKVPKVPAAPWRTAGIAVRMMRMKANVNVIMDTGLKGCTGGQDVTGVKGQTEPRMNVFSREQEESAWDMTQPARFKVPVVPSSIGAVPPQGMGAKSLDSAVSSMIDVACPSVSMIGLNMGRVAGGTPALPTHYVVAMLRSTNAVTRGTYSRSRAGSDAESDLVRRMRTHAQSIGEDFTSKHLKKPNG